MNIDWNKNPLIPAIAQDSETSEILMLAYMNEEAYKETIETKEVTFYSRSKQRLWTKGEESGNKLLLEDIKTTTDGKNGGTRLMLLGSENDDIPFVIGKAFKA